MNIRSKFVKVKTAKGRKLSSTNWLQRQLNDPFVQQAQMAGYRSRASYKLTEIDEKFKLITPKATVLDLGAAPGSWSQYLAQKNCKVLGVDLLEMEPIAGVEFIQGDFLEEAFAEQLTNFSTDGFDIILSDMAANTTGHSPTDHLRTIYLAEQVFYFAIKHLKPGGKLVMKVFQGGTESNLLKEIKLKFKTTKHFKPKASRPESKEIYLVALEFRG